MVHPSARVSPSNLSPPIPGSQLLGAVGARWRIACPPTWASCRSATGHRTARVRSSASSIRSVVSGLIVVAPWSSLPGCRCLVVGAWLRVAGCRSRAILGRWSRPVNCVPGGCRGWVGYGQRLHLVGAVRRRAASVAVAPGQHAAAGAVGACGPIVVVWGKPSMGWIVVGDGNVCPITAFLLLLFSIVRSHRGDATSQSLLRLWGPPRFLRRRRPFRPHRGRTLGLRRRPLEPGRRPQRFWCWPARFWKRSVGFWRWMVRFWDRFVGLWR